MANLLIDRCPSPSPSRHNTLTCWTSWNQPPDLSLRLSLLLPLARCHPLATRPFIFVWELVVHPRWKGWWTCFFFFLLLLLFLDINLKDDLPPPFFFLKKITTIKVIWMRVLLNNSDVATGFPIDVQTEGDCLKLYSHLHNVYFAG